MLNNKNFIMTLKKKPTRRGVMWLGQTCNLRCYFCYFANKIANKEHPEHKFFSLDKAKGICTLYSDEFNLNSIDIQGGEPTIYPYIFELIDHCNKIGLKPTLITNAVSLSKREYCKKFQDHGIYDFLISMQGYESNYDKVVGVENAFKKQMQALENISRYAIPFRVNAVLSKEIIEDLEKVVNIAVDHKARVINFIGFNNTGDQKHLRKKHQIPFYQLISEKISPLIDMLEDKNIEANIRFIPFCMFKDKYRKNIQNGKQKIYDLHEWEPASRLWIDRRAQREALRVTERIPNLSLSIFKQRLKKRKYRFLANAVNPFRRLEYSEVYPYQQIILDKIKGYHPGIVNVPGASKLEHYYYELNDIFCDKIKPQKCDDCDVNFICDGLTSDYLQAFGDDQVSPIHLGRKILDPKYYINKQLKMVEKQDAGWFFDNE